MDTEETVALGRKLDVLITISARQLQKRTDPVELIKALTRHGLPPSEIAPIVGMIPNAVRIALHRSRSARSSGRPHQSVKRPT